VLRQEFCFRNKRFGGQLQGLGGGRMKLYENQKGARKILFIQTFALGVVVRFLPLSGLPTPFNRHRFGLRLTPDK